jgi:hypothetical protein
MAVLRLATVTGEHVGSLASLRGPELEVFAEVVRNAFAVSVSVMHDQCRKYSATCTCTSGEREDRASYRYAFPLSCQCLQSITQLYPE